MFQTTNQIIVRYGIKSLNSGESLPKLWLLDLEDFFQDACEKKNHLPIFPAVI